MNRKHLFLTGEKHIGKSTLLRALLAQKCGTPGGFLTVRTLVNDAQYGVYLLRPGEVPNDNNFLFLCGHTADPQRFNELGCAALRVPADYILMDELGPNEALASDFQAAVLTALDGPVPIYGVLQKADSPFLQAIAAHPDVLVIEVTLENRDALRQTLKID